jgi:hypothetical protein
VLLLLQAPAVQGPGCATVRALEQEYGCVLVWGEDGPPVIQFGARLMLALLAAQHAQQAQQLEGQHAQQAQQLEGQQQGQQGGGFDEGWVAQVGLSASRAERFAR